METALNNTPHAELGSVPMKAPRTRRAPVREKAKSSNRQKKRKQVTVRIDDDLFQAATAVGEAEGLVLTDIVEDSLWLWLKQKRPEKAPVRLRFLSKVMSPRMQKLDEAFISWMNKPLDFSPSEEVLRKFFEEMLIAYRKGEHFEPRLQELGDPRNWAETA